jgi:N utilization substance protein A
VPEIFNGTVEIKSIAREPGQRSKVAVAATQPGVDPVGSCVGMRGTRIQNIVDELGGERIDVVEWSSDVHGFITNALSPAKPSDTLLLEEGDARTAVVIVPDRQLSLAIGKEGQNARLAAKLTGWRIDIKSESEANTEGLSEIKRQQMQLLKVRSLESKATASAATPPPDDLLSRAEWLLRERDKNAMTLDQVARMLSENEPGEQPELTAEGEAPVAEAGQPSVTEPSDTEPSVTAEAGAAAEAAAEPPALAAEASAAEAAAPEAAAQAAGEAGAAPAAEEMAVPEYESFDYVPEPEGEVEEEDSKAKGKGKAKKSAKKRELVFDEDLGQVVAVRKRKGSRGGWDDQEY